MPDAVVYSPVHQKPIGILTPTSSGSTGDQAAIDAATCFLSGDGMRRVIIGPNVFHTREGRPEGAQGKLTTLRTMGSMALRCRSIGMIGADILDGVYGEARILRRLQYLKTAHRLGCDVRVFGSSWSLTPSDGVIAELRRATWLKLHARDPISQSRMESVLDRSVTLVADLAFLLKPEIGAEDAQVGLRWIEARRAERQTILGLNLSGHTLMDAPDHGINAFAGLVGRWLDADPNRAVLIIPHDRRPGLVGDMQVLSSLNDILHKKYQHRLHMLPGTLDAWDIKGLVGKLDFVLTGRMHLAIAAMGMGVPALCTVYQGKFEGLMTYFGLKGMTVAPEDVMAERCDDWLAHMTTQLVDLEARIRARLPAVQELSRKNFIGM